MSQDRINLILLEPSSDKIGPLVGVLEKSNQVDILRVPTPRDAAQAALQFLPCVLIVSIQGHDDGRPQAILLKQMEKLIRSGQLKVLVVSKSKFHPLARAIAAFGVTDYAEEPIATKSLLFKMNLMFKSIHATRERMAEAKRKELVYRAKQDQQVSEQVTVAREMGANIKPALQIGSDTFIFMGIPPKKVGRNLILEAKGPLPETGNWVEELGDGIEPPKWRWMPSIEEPGGNPQATGEGNGWVHEGEKPSFDPRTGKWLLKSEKPRLSYLKNGKEVGVKVETDEFGEVSIAEDSQTAKDNLLRNETLAVQAHALKLKKLSSHSGDKKAQNLDPEGTNANENSESAASAEKSDYQEKDGSFNNLLGGGFGDSEEKPIQNKIGPRAAEPNKKSALAASSEKPEGKNSLNAKNTGKEETARAPSPPKATETGIETPKAKMRGALLKGPNKEAAKALKNFREKVRTGLLLDMEKEEIAEGVLNEDQLASAANSYQDRKGKGVKNFLDRDEEIKRNLRDRSKEGETEKSRNNSANLSGDANGEKKANRKGAGDQSEALARARAQKKLEQLKKQLQKTQLHQAAQNARVEKEKNALANKAEEAKAAKTKSALDKNAKALKDKIRDIEAALEGSGRPLAQMFAEDEDGEGWIQDDLDSPEKHRNFRAIESLQDKEIEGEEEEGSKSEDEPAEENEKEGRLKGKNAQKQKAAPPAYDSKSKRKGLLGSKDDEPSDSKTGSGPAEKNEAEEGNKAHASEPKAKGEVDSRDKGAEEESAKDQENDEPAAKAASSKDLEAKDSREKSQNPKENPEIKEGEKNKNGRVEKIKKETPARITAGKSSADDKEENENASSADDEEPESDKAPVSLKEFSEKEKAGTGTRAGKEKAQREKAAKSEGKSPKEKVPEASSRETLAKPMPAINAATAENATAFEAMDMSQAVFFLEQAEVVPKQGHWHSEAGIWLYLGNKTFESGFERLENILPFWTYAGELKPSFQLELKRWEFLGSAPLKISNSIEVPVLLIDFLDGLRSLFKKPPGATKAEPSSEEKKASLSAEGQKLAMDKAGKSDAASKKDAEDAKSSLENISKGGEELRAAELPSDEAKTEEASGLSTESTKSKPKVFYLKQTEVQPFEGQWHLIGGTWIYLSDKMYEEGISDLAEALPLWSFSGEKEPTLLSSNRKWEFIGTPPEKFAGEKELSEAVIEFLQDLQELKRMRSGELSQATDAPGESAKEDQNAKEGASARAQENENEHTAASPEIPSGGDKPTEELKAAGKSEEATPVASASPEHAPESSAQESRAHEPEQSEAGLRPQEPTIANAEKKAEAEEPPKVTVLLHARELLVLAVASDLKRQAIAIEEKIPHLLRALLIAFPQFEFDFQAGEAPPNGAGASSAPIPLPINDSNNTAKGFILASPPDARAELTVREERVFSLIMAAISNRPTAKQLGHLPNAA